MSCVEVVLNYGVQLLVFRKYDSVLESAWVAEVSAQDPLANNYSKCNPVPLLEALLKMASSDSICSIISSPY